MGRPNSPQLSPQWLLRFLLIVVFLFLTGCIDPCRIQGAACAPAIDHQGSINLLASPTTTPATPEPIAWIEPSPIDPTVIEASFPLSTGEQRTIDVPVTGSFLFLIVYGAMPLTITLVDPTGWVITPENALTEPTIRYQRQQGYLMVREGLSHLYQIAKPVTGEWQIILTTATVNKVSLYGTVRSMWQVRSQFDKASYRPGDLVTVQAMLAENDRPQIGAMITGSVSLPDGAHLPLTFADDGSPGDVTAQDGRYTAQFMAPGYNSHPQIDLRAHYEAVVRQESTTIQVVGPTATLQQVSAERAVDTDGNGLYERLEIDLLLAVQSAGSYEIQGELVDSNGQKVAFAMIEQPFNTIAVGLQTVTLVFDGAWLHAANSDGPYTVSNLRLKYTDPAVYFPFSVGTYENVYATAAYSVNQFEEAVR